MPGVTGSVIWAFEGETLPIDVTVYDSSGELATDIASASLVTERGLKKTTKVCTVAGAVISVVLTPEETLAMYGKSRFDFRVTDTGGGVKSVLAGIIWIRRAPVSSPSAI